MKKPINSFELLLFILATIILLSSIYITESTSFLGQKTSVYANTVAASNIAQKTLTYRGSTSANGVFSGSGLSVTLPSNIQAGDLLVAIAGTNGPISSWSTPKGWTRGTNSNTTDTQGLTWWWKIADGSETGSTIRMKSSKYADGGVVVNVYQGATADPIAGVSTFATTDNYGNGYVTSAGVSGMTLGTAVTAVPLIFVSWQPNAATISWPAGFAFESTASDGYATVAVAESLSSITSKIFPGYSLPIVPAQAVVQTLQVLIRVQ